MANALRVSILVMVLSGALIIVAGNALSEYPVYQAIAFAILGALLQTAVLGLIYEVFLRNEVEDATLEKLGTARDIREHGLIALGREATIDWSEILDSTRDLCVVSHDPKSLLGRSDDQILRKAAEGYLSRFTIVVPRTAWRASERWLLAYKEKWAANSPGAEFFAIKADSDAAFEFIGTESRSLVLLPRLADISGVEAAKLLQFRGAEDWGIGAWLARQRVGLAELNANIGHSEARAPVSPSKTAHTPEDESAPEELT